MGIEKLNTTLNRVLKSYGLYDGYSRHRAVIIWEKICGEQVAQFSQAESLRGHILFVIARDHIWANELRYFSSDFIEKFDKQLGAGVVKEIRFKGDIKLFQKLKNPPDKKKQDGDFPDVDSLPVTPEEEKKILEILREVKDEKLRQKLALSLYRKTKLDGWLKSRGGKECFHCKTIIEPGKTFCPPCRIVLDQINHHKLNQILLLKPWLSYHDASKDIIPLSSFMYEEVKRNLLISMEQKIYDMLSEDKGAFAPAEIKSDIITYAMLKTGKSPIHLTDDLLRLHLPGEMFEFYKKPF